MKARIFKPSKSAMQSAQGKTHEWVLECESPSRRDPEPLMGWTASGDTVNQVRLYFPTRQAAVSFAREKGWQYTVAPEHKKVVRPRNYADNFKYIPPGEVSR